MFHFLGTRTILVSATIPHELKSIPTTKVSNEQINSYLDLTKKNVSYMPWSTIDIKKGRTLVMANTRRKAANIFQCLIDRFPDPMYLSSGIRKKDRVTVLSQIRKKEQSNNPFILVATQVVEAGVDMSFSQIFREKAPLDSIIQVMGRLNREAENDRASLIVYEYDKEHNKYVLEDERDPVLIPDMKDWDQVKELLMMKKRLTKTDYRRLSNITASLPKKVYDLGIVDDFDPDALEKNILLPKKEYLNQVYDNILGTDKWLVTSSRSIN